MGRKAEKAKAAIKKATDKQPLPHLSELAENFVRECGGPREFAKALYTEWASAAPGGVVRARILDLIARVWRFASETTGHTEDLGLLTDEDLDQAIEDHLGRMAAAVGETDVAADQQPAAPAAGPVPQGQAPGSPAAPSPGAAAAPCPAAAPGPAPSAGDPDSGGAGAVRPGTVPPDAGGEGATVDRVPAPL